MALTLPLPPNTSSWVDLLLYQLDHVGHHPNCSSRAVLERHHLGKPHSWSPSVAGPPPLDSLWIHPSPAPSLTSSATAPNLWPSPQLPAPLPADHLTSCLLEKSRALRYEQLQFPNPYRQTHLPRSPSLLPCLREGATPPGQEWIFLP